MSPSEVLDKHTSREISEWMAYFRLEDMDQKLADSRSELKTTTKAPKKWGHNG